MDVAKQKGKVTARKTPPTLTTRIGSANTVAVSGDFNEWDPTGKPLEKNSAGEWSITLQLRPGEYQYRLLVDGHWHDHPEAQTRVPNPFGTQNCVLSVK